MPKPLTFRPEGEWFTGEPDLTVTTDNDFVMYPNGPTGGSISSPR